MKTTVLPWRHDSELAFVRDCFYPTHNTTTTADPYAAITTSPTIPSSLDPTTVTPSYDLGLRRVNIWTFHSPRSVPRAVTATAKLIDAKLHDERFFLRPSSSHDPRISQDAMKGIYGMAFVRFVNAFVDRDVVRSSKSEIGTTDADSDSNSDSGSDDDAATAKARGAGESSMYAHAVAVGMPAAFVDLRHRCVHGDVPGLGVLRGATERALEWLWARWWRGNARGDSARFRFEMEEDLREGDGGLGELRVDV